MSEDALWLNVGCGELKHLGWVNIDSQPWVSPDVVASALDLPYEDGSVARIYMGHVAEHLGYDDELPAALAEARRVLKRGGEILLVGPDTDRIRETGDNDLVEANRTGARRWDGDQHRWECTEALLLKAVRKVFKSAMVAPLADVYGPWPVMSPAEWQCVVIAHA